jgi:hypothetical protein
VLRVATYFMLLIVTLFVSLAIAEAYLAFSLGFFPVAMALAFLFMSFQAVRLWLLRVPTDLSVSAESVHLEFMNFKKVVLHKENVLSFQQSSLADMAIVRISINHGLLRFSRVLWLPNLYFADYDQELLKLKGMAQHEDRKA